MKRVTGIGGIFFQAEDPGALRAWYQKHLGIDLHDWGGAVFSWGKEGGMTVWNISVLDKFEESELGKFGWVMDPAGHKVELWETPPGS